ncbi:unnamed protein product [Dibothriocephalus latus]|uniref:Uncharacterized protein n=1 Tax=Dibothriocephalus latus TaxID=60516 RepID=A0A3P7RWC4_DIBLA|nr:unnamed protein product [Dibothriocephalus latus]
MGGGGGPPLQQLASVGGGGVQSRQMYGQLRPSGQPPPPPSAEGRVRIPPLHVPVGRSRLQCEMTLSQFPVHKNTDVIARPHFLGRALLTGYVLGLVSLALRTVDRKLMRGAEW